MSVQEVTDLYEKEIPKLFQTKSLLFLSCRLFEKHHGLIWILLGSTENISQMTFLTGLGLTGMSQSFLKRYFSILDPSPSISTHTLSRPEICEKYFLFRN